MRLMLPFEAPDDLKQDNGGSVCPSCDLIGGPISDVLNIVGQCDGDLSQLALIHPNPSATLVDLFALAQRERLALSSAMAERARKKSEDNARSKRRRR